jgi:hypothetical protein
MITGRVKTNFTLSAKRTKISRMSNVESGEKHETVTDHLALTLDRKKMIRVQEMRLGVVSSAWRDFTACV